jgi:replicative DNA helicase
MKLSAPIFRLKRQAKLLSRQTNEPLHAMLNDVARQEGFRSWSHLAGSVSSELPAAKLLACLTAGDFVLLGARPGHGKTLLGLQLMVEAHRAGRPSFYFSLEETKSMISDRLEAIGFEMSHGGNAPTIDTSDGICADYIIGQIRAKADQSLVVVDYLQLLDQKRQNPELSDQVEALADFARATGATIVAISQIDRSFDPRSKAHPDLDDVRLPNPIDVKLFTKTCFLHDGEIRIDAVN